MLLMTNIDYWGRQTATNIVWPSNSLSSHFYLQGSMFCVLAPVTYQHGHETNLPNRLSAEAACPRATVVPPSGGPLPTCAYLWCLHPCVVLHHVGNHCQPDLGSQAAEEGVVCLLCGAMSPGEAKMCCCQLTCWAFGVAHMYLLLSQQ